MNRFLLLALLGYASPAFCQVQDLEISMQVLGATGKSTIQAGRYYAYTVGEPFVFTLQGPVTHLTQGFHQPDLGAPVSSYDLDLAAWQIKVFPNPTTDFLQIQYSADQNSRLDASVFDVLGRQIVHNAPLHQPGGSLLDCASWQAGVYFLQLRDPATQAGATMRFIKL